MVQEGFEGSQDVDREAYRAGKANWDAFDQPLDVMKLAAADWESVLTGIDKPWLCWNVDNDWCLVQQRLVLSAGWTPVVGYDPRAGAPEVEEGAILVDFNERFQYPALHMVFPLEWVFLYCDRLAFWHSDLLLRHDRIRELAALFESVQDGTTVAVDARAGLMGRLRGRKGRFWELIGCTTREASRDQFEKGAGWWRHIKKHPNCPDNENERTRRQRYGYDHGVGILYWHNRYGGNVIPVPQDSVDEGHCTGIGQSNYKRVSPRDERRDLSRELSANYDLEQVCKRLDLGKFL